MPMLEAQEYERFSYDEKSLTLDEAVKKARDLRQSDATNFYRIKHVDESHTSFTVTKVPVSSVYADFMARVAKMMGRYKFRVSR